MPTSCCKPLRLIELTFILFGFSFLFLLRKYDAQSERPISSNLLICLFTCYGSLLLLLAADSFCQLVKQPIANTPMVEVLAFGIVSCCISVIFTLISQEQHSNYALRSVNVLSLLNFISISSCVIFVLDLILVIRFA